MRPWCTAPDQGASLGRCPQPGVERDEVPEEKPMPMREVAGSGVELGRVCGWPPASSGYRYGSCTDNPHDLSPSPSSNRRLPRVPWPAYQKLISPPRPCLAFPTSQEAQVGVGLPCPGSPVFPPRVAGEATGRVAFFLVMDLPLSRISRSHRNC